MFLLEVDDDDVWDIDIDAIDTIPHLPSTSTTDHSRSDPWMRIDPWTKPRSKTKSLPKYTLSTHYTADELAALDRWLAMPAVFEVVDGASVGGSELATARKVGLARPRNTQREAITR